MPQAAERSRRSFRRILLSLIAVGFLALIAAAVAVFWMQSRIQETSREVEHTLSVETRIGEFAALNERAETARRGYLLSADPRFERIFQNTIRGVPPLLDSLTVLTIDNPNQTARVDRLKEIVRDQHALQQRSMLSVRAGEGGRTISGFDQDRGVLLTRQVRGIANAMGAEENRLLAERTAKQNEALRTFNVLLVALGLLLVLVAAATIVIMLRYTREIEASQGALRQLNLDLESLVEERTSDLQRANQEIQRFAYIVSHDLRSPLVNVMGFTAELEAARKTIMKYLENLGEAEKAAVPKDVVLAAEEDLPEAIGFIRTSTEKMDRLINAILRLSREGRRNLAPERVDTRALVQSIVDSLHQRIGGAGAEVKLADLPPIVTDRLALEQILSNLIENAIKYLSPARPGWIRVSGRRERDRVVFQVEDNGRGIDPRDHERIFDLFRRSGAQDQPGEGIGLAHVRALAYRLGGTIDVKSELDQGATFRLSLPAAFSDGE